MRRSGMLYRKSSVGWARPGSNFLSTPGARSPYYRCVCQVQDTDMVHEITIRRE